MGPYQTLRAETWWTLLQMTFRVFFSFSKDPEIPQMGPKKAGGVISEKKGPCQETPGCRPNSVFTKNRGFPGLG